MKVYARIKSKMIVDCAIAAVKSKLKFPPFLTCFPHRRSPSAQV